MSKGKHTKNRERKEEGGREEKKLKSNSPAGVVGVANAAMLGIDIISDSKINDCNDDGDN